MTIKECIHLPTEIHSSGFWNYFRSGTIPSTLPLLELQMVVIFAITRFTHCILKPYGIPEFTSQLIAGIILGPSVLGRLGIFKVLFSDRNQEIVAMIATFGHVLFTFMSGVKMDAGVINRVGRKSLFAGIACIMFPLLVGFTVQVTLRRYWLTAVEATGLPFETALNCLTPFPVVVYLLESLKILNSELGQLGLSAALVSDIFGSFLLWLASMAKVSREKGMMGAAISASSSITYVFVVVFAFRPAMFWVIRQTPEGRPVKRTHLQLILMLMLFAGLLSQWFHASFLFGPLMLGLAVPDGPPLGSAIIRKFYYFNQDVFLPLFVTTCAMRTDLRLIKFNDSFMTFNVLLIFFTFSAKMIAPMVPLLYTKMPLNDALALALILSSKGEIHLALNTQFRDTEPQAIQTGPALTLSNIAILLNAVIAPVLVKYLYDPSRKYAGYQKRNIMHNKRNAELRILVCIHKPENIVAAIKLLESSCPTRERPLGIYVLHLIELIGRSSPIFISHEMKKKTLSKTSAYSDNVISAFNNFQKNNRAGVATYCFTAISPTKFMHEDICTLALDKLASLIVLPFHRKWSVDGSIQSEDSSVRTLNNSVLEIAPCSVGILVDRGGHSKSSNVIASKSPFSVAMIFVGGNDDREALTFAKRMANENNITLTVVHFVTTDSEDITIWDKLLDNEVLKDVKMNNVGQEYVIYLEERVKDGPQTAMIVRSMVDEYDLIIVGRRDKSNSTQTSGLAEWNEFPELGIIGDLLASSDFNSKTSVLVIQQQKKKT
ncbi:cation/H(+) antiporter 3-like [Juglans microcarpa x Juglans regia]|uniref:cation/H(+) antiporter 3-like n=1 Tax=Juglans microcarpa x Juglans regia TaxID=2249226 RepID=UPI001B7EAE38|nr:cation/H(+) antiporter 3-like [Juglans microcarpa x Juglans regia]